MSSKTKFIFFLSLVFLLADKSDAQDFLKASGQQIVNEKNENVLLRGIGLGGWMLQEGYMLKFNRGGQQHIIRAKIDSLIGTEKTNEFYTAWLNNHTTKADIDSLKKWGFNSVRLPMHYGLYTLPADKEKNSQQTWIEKGFEMTDNLLSWCKANKMYLILDLHATPGGQGNDTNISDRDDTKPSLWESEANQQKTIALWRRLAQRYAHEAWIGAYDIINEPNWGFDDATDRNGLKEKTNAPLRKLMMDITKAIREVDQKHIIIIEGNGWGNNYSGIFPVWDDNMVISFHKYWNYNNQASIQNILDTRNKYNVPVWIGETGENSNVWYTEAITLLEKNNIGWAWWPLKKIGNNNPLEVKSSAVYDAVLDYFNGNGKKPDAGDAYKGLMELADNLKTENNVVHKDVLDAMFRQPFSEEAIPYKKNTVENKTTIDAVDYDMGKNGIAYFDNDSADYHVSKNGSRGGNKGRAYRNDGVDIRKDSSGTYYVTSMEAGEWMQYTIDVKKKADYILTIFATAEKQQGKISLFINSKLLTASFNVDPATAAQNWQSIKSEKVSLKKGTHLIRVQANQGVMNIKSIQFDLVK